MQPLRRNIEEKNVERVDNVSLADSIERVRYQKESGAYIATVFRSNIDGQFMDIQRNNRLWQFMGTVEGIASRNIAFGDCEGYRKGGNSRWHHSDDFGRLGRIYKLPVYQPWRADACGVDCRYASDLQKSEEKYKNSVCTVSYNGVGTDNMRKLRNV